MKIRFSRKYLTKIICVLNLISLSILYETQRKEEEFTVLIDLSERRGYYCSISEEVALVEKGLTPRINLSMAMMMRNMHMCSIPGRGGPSV